MCLYGCGTCANDINVVTKKALFFIPTLVSGISVGRVTPSAARSLFSSSVRNKVAAFLSDEDEDAGEGLWVEERGLEADTSEDTDPLISWGSAQRNIHIHVCYLIQKEDYCIVRTFQGEIFSWFSHTRAGTWKVYHLHNVHMQYGTWQPPSKN